ncbi:Com family DNA-binding transcriptional regulator [Serratia marcescens]|nr:Com family DNA-binding transcriptional regulator [Serratia marcescens]
MQGFSNGRTGVMREIRCARCSKLLARAAFSHLQIKCPRCKAFNDMKAESLSSSTTECPAGKLNRGENQTVSSSYTSTAH